MTRPISIPYPHPIDNSFSCGARGQPSRYYYCWPETEGSEIGIWVLNLAVADFIFLLCLPFQAISFYLDSFPFGEYLCKLFMFFSTVNMYVSIFTLMALTVDRCISVVTPLWHHQNMTRRFSFWVCLVLWILTGLLSIPILIHAFVGNYGNASYCLVGFQLENSLNITNILPVFFKPMATQTSEEVQFRTAPIGMLNQNQNRIVKNTDAIASETVEFQRRDCKSKNVQSLIEDKMTDEDIDNWNATVFSSEFICITLIIVGYFIPLIIIITSNIIMTLYVKQSKFMKSRKSSNLYKVIVAMVTAYFLAWTPANVLVIAFMIAFRKMDFNMMFNLLAVIPLIVSITYFHSCLNPILYVLVGQNVRREFRKFWHAKTLSPQ
ncbi:C3a anaphylatoxin chemotactic receptor [Microcaecilia unicolor]|uniref:C3a anaphylatoxin chemotactic receptor-like n=1 Tax=Microcaecilia unicolor TaxID=1415580 RepID=A0A6P7Z1K4_9AMPH|nr:C3a anaphylatoxin chemotactic receptor-like [Microcaecilia unicolor]